MLLVRRVYGLDPGRMTWAKFVRAITLAPAFVLWEQGRGRNPADVPPPAPDAAALGLTGVPAPPRRPARPRTARG